MSDYREEQLRHALHELRENRDLWVRNYDEAMAENKRLNERLSDQVRMTLAGEAVIERLQRDLGTILNRISTAAAEDDTAGMVAALDEGRNLINATVTWSAGGQPGGGQP